MQLRLTVLITNFSDILYPVYMYKKITFNDSVKRHLHRLVSFYFYKRNVSFSSVYSGKENPEYIIHSHLHSVRK